MKTEIIEIDPADIGPSPESILNAQGIEADSKVQSRVRELADEACRMYASLAKPIGLIMPIDEGQLQVVYDGIGNNDLPNPLEDIFPNAQARALFAVTSGASVTQKISDLFAQNDFALGSLLDTAASEGTDNSSRVLEKYFARTLQNEGMSATVMAYSPGYCGWHVSAQKALFDLLKPQQIGITLRDSFLMEPLKSISGALIAGPGEIHIFENSYAFCGQCRNQSCLLRMQSISGS